MNEENKRRKGNWFASMEFSKKLLMMECAASGLLVIAVVILALRGGDIAILSGLTGASILANGTVSGFYLWKSKVENRAKYAEKFALEFAEKYGFESALQITETVLRE